MSEYPKEACIEIQEKARHTSAGPERRLWGVTSTYIWNPSGDPRVVVIVDHSTRAYPLLPPWLVIDYMEVKKRPLFITDSTPKDPAPHMEFHDDPYNDEDEDDENDSPEEAGAEDNDEDDNPLNLPSIPTPPG